LELLIGEGWLFIEYDEWFEDADVGGGGGVVDILINIINF
jgi:hypothetical protein